MKFNTFGKNNAPVIIMLAGSFCPGTSMENIYNELMKDHYIIVPDYNGHYEGSKDFTTRQNEAAELAGYIQKQGISSVRLVYGQSMGAEIGIELVSQLAEAGVRVENAVFDGAPCIKLSKAYKMLMLAKFRSMLKVFKGKSIDEAMNIGIVKRFSNGNANSLKEMIVPILGIAQFITDQSIKNEVECCYTFDFPELSENMQKRMHFFYAAEEKAYKTCYKYVKKAYPCANYRVEKGYGHLTYSQINRSEYIQWLRSITE